jgi:putative sterol carrier protein
MQAFMSGRIKIEGDMTLIMTMAQRAPTPEQEAYAAEVLRLTTS